MNFRSLLDMIQFRANILNAAGAEEKKTTAPIAKVAATTAVQPQESSRSTTPEKGSSGSYAQRVAASPPLKQSTTRCGVCNSFHETAECATLAHLEPDAKVEKLKEKKLCFHCLQSGHEARQCDRKRPRCVVCHKAHHTVLHGRTYPSPATCQSMSAKAQPFQPALRPTQNPSTQTKTNTTVPTDTANNTPTTL